jgi:hypothetical protein
VSGFVTLTMNAAVDVAAGSRAWLQPLQLHHVA